MHGGGNDGTGDPRRFADVALHLGAKDHFRLQRFDGLFDHR